MACFASFAAWPPAPARPRSAPPRLAASGRRAALVRRTPSRRVRDVSGSAARCIASASADASVGSTTIPFTPSCTIVPTAPVIGDTTTGAPSLRASTTTRPMKSWRVGNTNAWQAWKAPLRAWWSTVPRKVTASSTPSRRLSWTRRLPLGAVADDPQDARAEPPPVDREGADHQVGALLGDEPAGADEQRHPSGTGAAAGGCAARSAGMPASHQPTMIFSSGTLSVRIR